MRSDVELEDPIEDPIDPDVDLWVPAQRRELVRHHGPVLGVIALGGGLGALAHYGHDCSPTVSRVRGECVVSTRWHGRR